MGDFRELYIYKDNDKSLNQVLKYIEENDFEDDIIAKYCDYIVNEEENIILFIFEIISKLIEQGYNPNTQLENFYENSIIEYELDDEQKEEYMSYGYENPDIKSNILGTGIYLLLDMDEKYYSDDIIKSIRLLLEYIKEIETQYPLLKFDLLYNKSFDKYKIIKTIINSSKFDPNALVLNINDIIPVWYLIFQKCSDIRINNTLLNNKQILSNLNVPIFKHLLYFTVKLSNYELTEKIIQLGAVFDYAALIIAIFFDFDLDSAFPFYISNVDSIRENKSINEMFPYIAELIYESYTFDVNKIFRNNNILTLLITQLAHIEYEYALDRVKLMLKYGVDKIFDNKKALKLYKDGIKYLNYTPHHRLKHPSFKDNEIIRLLS